MVTCFSSQRATITALIEHYNFDYFQTLTFISYEIQVLIGFILQLTILGSCFHISNKFDIQNDSKLRGNLSEYDSMTNNKKNIHMHIGLEALPLMNYDNPKDALRTWY